MAGLDSYLSGIRKEGNSKKKIDWSRAFEDDALTNCGRPISNQTTSLKSAARADKVKRSSASSCKVSSDISSFSVSETEQHHLLIERPCDSDEGSDSRVGFDSEASPLGATVYSIDELIQTPFVERGSSDTSSHGQFLLLHTVDELQPIGHETESEVSLVKQPDKGDFTLLMTADEREFTNDTSAVSVASKASVNSTTPMSSEESDKDNNNDDDDDDDDDEGENDNILGNKDVEYSESFDSDSQDSLCSLEKQTKLLEVSVNSSNAVTGNLDWRCHPSPKGNFQAEDDDESGPESLEEELEEEKKRSLHSSSATILDQSSPFLPFPCLADVGVQTDSHMRPGTPSTAYMQGMARHLSINSVVLNTLCAYSPATLALHEMVREQFNVTKSFVTSCQYMADTWRKNYYPGYQYTTLEDTQWYIKQHRPKVRTMTEAMNEVDQAD